MARKTRLDATPILHSNTAETEAETDTSSSEGSPRASGFWGGSMVNLMKGELRESRERLAALAAGVGLGIVTVEIPTNQIEDRLGSDRAGDWRDEEDFTQLVEDIRRRGQRAPVRVRPLDPAWQPDPTQPLAVGESRFLLQSGRRRLAACAALGRPVLALISTPESDAEIDDLEERFLENTVRKSLTAFEELMSIGLIANRLTDISQREVAERLRVSAPDVSLGVACVELRDAIMEAIDVATAPKRDYRDLIPKLRKRREASPAPSRKTSPDPVVRRNHRFRRFTATVASSPRGTSVTIRGWRGDPEHLAKRIDALLAELDREE